MIKVAIVDDHPIMRDGLAHVIRADDGLELVAAVASVEDLGSDPAADVVVLDLGLPGLSGPVAVEHIRGLDMAVLVVSADGDRQQVVDAFGAGAAGYLTKASEGSEIVRALMTIASGGTYVSPTLASFLITAAKEERPHGPVDLSPREREVLALVAAGERDVDIAEELFISVRTVHSHLERIRDKTGFRRRPDLTRLAYREGLVEPG